MFLYLFVGIFIFHSKVGNNIYIQISVLEYLTELKDYYTILKNHFP